MPVSGAARSGVLNGAMVLEPPPPSTRNSWPFASPERLSPATPGEPVRRLLVDLRRRRIAVAVRNRRVAPGDDDVVEAGGQSPRLLEERKRVVAERGEVGHRGPQVLDQATELVLGDQLAELADPRVRVVERLVGGLHAGKGLAREGAQRREVLVELEQRRAADGERLGQLDDRVAQRGLVGGEVAADRVEVGDQALQVAAVGVQLPGRRRPGSRRIRPGRRAGCRAAPGSPARCTRRRPARSGTTPGSPWRRRTGRGRRRTP